jgi:hypothetical protein
VIPESAETEGEADVEDDLDREEYRMPGSREDAEIAALKAALEECWTLCNTLANLSSIHRERVFNNSGTPDAHEKAWKSCWKLCKRLYNSRDDVSESLNIRTNLDLCRDFCQALFDVRQRKGDPADSVLRVSFELNNQYVCHPRQILVDNKLLLTTIAVYTARKIVGSSRKHSESGHSTSTLPCVIA